MKNFEAEINLLSALLRLTPASSELRWERAVTFERWGNALLKRNDVDGALAKFRTCLAEKGQALLDANEPGDAKVDANRRLGLARNYLGVATLERAQGRIAEARDDCQAAIRTLEERRESGTTKEINDVMQDARNILKTLGLKC